MSNGYPAKAQQTVVAILALWPSDLSSPVRSGLRVESAHRRQVYGVLVLRTCMAAVKHSAGAGTLAPASELRPSSDGGIRTK
jgi:hypothetical protein